MVFQQNEVKELILQYFTEIFSSNGNHGPYDILQDMPVKVTEEMNAVLTKPVSEVEIHNALWQMSGEKAPGPDGLTACFYQDHWDTVKYSLLSFVQNFLQSCELDQALNHTHICLIPKIENPVQVKDFRPISLSNVAYKILSKVLAERLKGVLPDIISDNQSAFIPNRLITDNVLIAHEMLHSLRTRKMKDSYMALKLDISKAFDRVDWHFLESLMKKLGFADIWCKWIMKCVTSVTYSALINGTPTEVITPSRGLRQGDPLSPYLYLICTEALSFLLSKARENKVLSGFQVCKKGPTITHLLFADDSLLFCKATVDECNELLNILRIYKEASGQEVNFAKSSIMFSKGINQDLKFQILQLTNIQKVGGLGKYLGLPENVGRNKMETFTYLVQRLTQKVENWYSKLLSQAGKETLIKSVLLALPTYCMQCFMLPKGLIERLQAVIRKFFWSSSQDRNKLSWISWEKITNSKYMGGLGIRDLKDFNTALLAKQSWRILQEPSSLIARVFKAKYYPKTTLLEATQRWSSSYAWRSILQGNKLIKQGVKWNIGTGEKILFWRDPWLPTTPSRAPSPIGDTENFSLTVKDMLHPGTSRWNEANLEKLVQHIDIPLIKRQVPSTTGAVDRINWMHTTNGNYSVRSGYNLLRSQKGQTSLIPSPLFKNLWKQQLPPKIHHFWWKAVHDALPVAKNLKHRKILQESTCSMCGEGEETLEHMLFFCRISKEIWDLASFKDVFNSVKSHDNFRIIYDHIFEALKDSNDKLIFFHFLGWRIWKNRNELLFQSRRWPIPSIINKAISEHGIWSEVNAQDHLHKQNSVEASCGGNVYNGLNQLTGIPSSHQCCIVDASWKSPYEKIGISWSLLDSSLQERIYASGVLQPTITPSHAEAEALRAAIIELHKLGYRNVIFCGDFQTLYGFLQKGNWNLESSLMKFTSYSVILNDILTISKLCNFSFKHVSRNIVARVDCLAKHARSCSQSYVVTWTM